MTFWLVLLSILGSVNLAWGTTYYTDKAGSNANSCATAATASSDRTKAKLTLGNAASSGGVGCLNAGDTLIVGDGTYTESEIYFTRDGTSGNPITVQAENRHLAIINTTSAASCSPAFSIYASYTTVDGFAITTNAGSSCGARPTPANAFVRCWDSQIPRISGPSTTGDTNCTVRWLSITDSIGAKDTGIKINQDNGIVEYNDLPNSIETFNNNGTIVRYNHVTGPDAWGDHIYGKGGIRNNEFHHNFVEHANSGSQRGLHLGGNSGCCWWDEAGTKYEAYTSSAHHNIVKFSGTAGTGWSLGMVACSSCTIYNNTVIDGGFFMSTFNATTANPIWKNNIEYQSSSQACLMSQWQSTGLSIDYNDFYNCTSAPSQTHAFTANPTFVNAAGDDYGLQASSTLINAGVDVSLAYNGSAPDIGAHETLQLASCSVETATPTVINATFENNLNFPLLPASSPTGFSASGKTVSTQTRTSTNQVDITVTAAYGSGDSVLLSYATGTGNIYDSACIGDGTCATGNQRLNAFTDSACLNNISGVSYTWTQSRFGFYALRGTEAGISKLPASGSADNTNKTVMVGGAIGLRMKVNCTGADCPADGFILRYSKNGGAYTVVPDTFGADNIAYYTTADPDVVSQSSSTTERLTSDYATNVTGIVVRTANAIPSVDLSQDSEIELLYFVRLDSDATAGDTYAFRLYRQGGDTITYSQTPTLTVVPVSAGGGP